MASEHLWGVVCDFDGTISKLDATDAILEALAEPEWREIEALWVRGAIGSRECLERQVGCLRASGHQLNALIDGVEIDPAFADFVSFCKRRAIPLAIVSDGLDYVIKRILERERITGISVFANALAAVAPASFSISFPHARIRCGSGVCKCAVLQHLRQLWDGRQLMFVGDGRSDFCAAASAADFVAAKSSLLDHLSARLLPCVAYDSFSDVQSILDRLNKGLATSTRGLEHACAQ